MNDYLNNSTQRYLLDTSDAQSSFLSQMKEQYLEKNYAAYLQKLQQKKPQFSILEIGPGSGSFAFWLKKKFPQASYKALDIDSGVVQYLQQKGFNVTQTENLSADLKQDSATYDGLVLLDVLEHIPLKEAQKILSLIPQKLNLEGVVLIQVPNLSAPFGGNIYYGDITHCLALNEISMEQLLRSASLKNFEIKPYLLPNGLVRTMQSGIRQLFYALIHLMFFITGTIRCKILTPNLVVVIKK